jgi:signal transduction histidine kinase
MTFDPDQIRRVLTNLFDNVVTTNEDISSVRVDISLAPTKDHQSVSIAFTDNGPGIPPENLKRIFDPYFTTRQEGTGLGLAMLRSIIVQHGGTVTVSSVVNHGTTFHIELPMAGPPEPSAEKES